jgi:DNA-binding transcriptional ArsR family regulator
MPDQYANDLKEFGRVSQRLGELQTEITNLTMQRDQLQRRLRAHMAVAHGGVPVESDGATPEAVREVVEALRRLNGSARVGDIAAALGISERAATSRLLRAEKAELIEREARGRYRLRGVLVDLSSVQDGESAADESER